MPGLGDSRWASKCVKDTSASAPLNCAGQAGADRHVCVPSFGFSLSNLGTTEAPSVSSVAKPLSKAEAAGKAAASRMDEIQGTPFTLNKSNFYSKYDQPINKTLATSNHSISHGGSMESTTDQAKPARLNELFRRWVPHGEEFYRTYLTLGLGEEEATAVQNEIIRNRIKTALADNNTIKYMTPWEIPPQYLPVPVLASNSLANRNVQQSEETAEIIHSDDPFGLGLTSSSSIKISAVVGADVDLLG